MTNPLEQLSTERGKILANFQYIESLLRQYIAKHYFQTYDDQVLFSREVLEDEFFSFFLLRKIFQKVLKKYQPDQYQKVPLSKLDTLVKLRNLAAHAGIEGTAQLASAGSVRLTSLFFRHGGEVKSIKNTIDSYNKLRDEIQPILEALVQIRPSDRL